MSMSTHIKGFIKDTDPLYQKHKKVLLACNEAEVSLPKETADYFESDDPDLCLLGDKLEIPLKRGIHYKEYSEDMLEGFEVNLSDLPRAVSKLLFYNSY